MRLLCTIFLFFLMMSTQAGEVLNVYNWSNYMPQSVLNLFTRETGVEVNYSVYDSNEALYAKLKSNPSLGYDVIFPTSYLIKRMTKEGMLHRLDKHQLSNWRYLKPALLGRSFDIKNNYSLPFQWGITGIVVNQHHHNMADIRSWKDLWSPRYKNQLLILNDRREAFSIALIRLGYSINEKDPKHIAQAYHLLQQLMPNIRVINTVSANNLYLDSDITLGMGWNGDIAQVMLDNPAISFVYPATHYAMWIDCVAIPKQAPHVAAALRFMNFLMRPDVAVMIAKSLHYPPANRAAMKLLPSSWQHNRAFNPSLKTLARAELQTDVGDALPIYDRYWQRLKLGG